MSRMFHRKMALLRAKSFPATPHLSRSGSNCGL